MTIRRLGLLPDSVNYSALSGNTTIMTALAGGPPRSRLDAVDTSWVVTVQWTLNDPADYDYLMAFWRSATLYGSLPFTCPLVIGRANPIDYSCYFQPNTFGLTQQSGLLWVVSATLIVDPDTKNNDVPADDEVLLERYANTDQSSI